MKIMMLMNNNTNNTQRQHAFMRWKCSCLWALVSLFVLPHLTHVISVPFRASSVRFRLFSVRFRVVSVPLLFCPWCDMLLIIEYFSYSHTFVSHRCSSAAATATNKEDNNDGNNNNNQQQHTTPTWIWSRCKITINSKEWRPWRYSSIFMLSFRFLAETILKSF